MQFRKMAILFGAVLFAGTATVNVLAEGTGAWPQRAITLIVPFAAGGGGDTLARLVAEPLGRELGQAVIIENRPGAGGNIGTATAARAKPDGYTLSYGTNGTEAINHWLYKDPGYTPKDFEPISRFTVIAAALVVNPGEPFKTLQELIAYGKKNPGKLTCGSAGNGTTSHLSCELFKQMTGLDIAHIPYRGGAAALTDLLGGRISMLIDVMPNLAGQIKAGKLHALAVTTKKRVESNPDIPTFDEAGVPGYAFFAWDGLYAPKGTPPEVLDRLNQAVNTVLSKPAVQESLRSRGAIPSPTTRAELKQFGAEEYARLGDIVKKSGAVID
ncbi:tripartite tricarboxylate transporter substrate binding protein [Paralcaligenes sp. KSB-10]|uniref:Bug family tripartite tricarboxylate transporter substrate binding protein n=1 Tax=Paralcaligenes sp. KSB-10 TaxID=2901142 RepID=UPI001E5A311B|nr:tripartite tricarboxylate transporter substrate binding protein [Paralcaligenes sp. KSB-10]UHL62474.1 tripartite tricarboxylate transporter substrate binding protein [Paralcaligenes sp. KSB-10]